jgi:LysM repeat protein
MSIKNVLLLVNAIIYGVIAVVMCGIMMTIMINNAPNIPYSAAQNSASLTPSETIPPTTPLPTLTPSSTLRPPPTLEPPSSTPPPSLTPTITATSTIDSSISVEGLHGLETATPTSTAGCKPREDWKLTYTIQLNDALVNIAQKYGTSVDELVAGNCIADPNVIVMGQNLRVPGESQPVKSISCTAWEALTPANGTINVPADGTVTFNWRGPEADRYLLRIVRPDGTTYEEVFDLRQNQVLALENLLMYGTYTWYVYPLDMNFRQIACKEGGPWTFTKPAGATLTPTATEQPPQPSFLTSAQAGTAPLEVQFFDQSRGEIAGYAWDFGDGSFSDSQNPIHTYTQPGVYFVKLTVYGPTGSSDFSTMLITVN